MPEARKDVSLGLMVQDLQRRSQTVEKMLHTLLEVLLESPGYFGEFEGPDRLVFRVLPALSQQQRDKLLGLAKEWGNEAGPPGEVPLGQWRHLVTRYHPWRRQPYIKGRNMTVRQLLGTVKANRFTPEQAAEDLDLPVEAIHEALAFAETHRDLLESDAAYERHLRAQGEHDRGTHPVPR